VIINVELSKAAIKNFGCGVIGEQLTEACILLQCLTGHIYFNFMQYELRALLKKVPPETRQIYYQHDIWPPHFSWAVRQNLNQQFRKGRIGSRSAQNCPPRSPEPQPLYRCAWDYMKDMVMHATWRREKDSSEFSAFQHINKAELLLKFESFVVTRVIKYMQVDGGQFNNLHE
jgi:hypothetical protein